MAKLYIGYDDYALEGIDDEFIQFIFDVVVGLAKLHPESEAGLVLTTDKRMQELNKQYRGKDKSTNILSFAYAETTPEEFRDSDDKEYLGDIFISRAQLKKDAQAEGMSEKKRFVQLVTHGLLHLAGMHHPNDEAASKMEALEDRVIELVLPD